MTQKFKPMSAAQKRESMRLLMAAAALFVLLFGLTLLTYLVLFTDRAVHEATIAFFPFFLVGVLLFAASALINTETVKALMSAANPVKGASQ